MDSQDSDLLDTRALELAVSFYEIARPIFQTLKEEIRRTADQDAHSDAAGLTFAQLKVLLAIQLGKDQVGKLAHSLRVAQPAISRIVEYLLSQGFITRAPLAHDRRQVKLNLTPAGIELANRIRLRAARKYLPALEALSKAERSQLADGITVLLKVIEQTKSEEPSCSIPAKPPY